MQIAHATLRNKGSPAHVLLRTPSQKNGFERVHAISRSGVYGANEGKGRAEDTTKKGSKKHFKMQRDGIACIQIGEN